MRRAIGDGTFYLRKVPNMASLTPRQQEILAYLRRYIAEYGIAPTYDEIGAAFGICKVTVLAHIRQLEKKGLIRHTPFAARGIEVCGEEEPGIPVAGVIQAGRPILAVEEAEKENLLELIPVGEDLFALRVTGDSMIEDHIRDGDYVMIRKTDTADPGDVVVALIDDEEATLKRFFPSGRYVKLEPANAAYEPIVVERERVRIQGKVVGMLRLY